MPWNSFLSLVPKIYFVSLFYFVARKTKFRSFELLQKNHVHRSKY